MAFCINCGATLKPEVKFCDNCGVSVPTAARETGAAQEAPARQGAYAPPAQDYAPPAQQVQSGHTTPAQQGGYSYTPPTQQAQGGYTPPAQGYAPPAQQAQGGYTPPAQQAQGGYAPPAQGYAPPAQRGRGYTPPAQQVQGGYAPPAQGYAPPAQQGQGYTPPAQQPQGGYTPPAQGYTPPAQQGQGGYAPPAQPAYGAQPVYGAPQAAPKQRKPLDKKLLMFGGIGLAAVAVIIILVLALGGGKADPYVGVWNGVRMEAEGMSLDVKEVLGGGIVFDIKGDGSCTLTFGPETLSGKWEKTKDGILIKAGAYTLPCAVKGSAMVIENYADSGMTLTLEKAAGNASSDPNVGVWNVVTAEMWGIETDISDVFENGFTIELLDKGKCKLNIDGTKGNGKWTLEDGVITIKGGGLDVSGTLKNGVLTLEDVMGIGLNLKLQKEGSSQSGLLPFPDPTPAEVGEPAFESPTTTLETDSIWYGTATMSNFLPADRAAEVEGSRDVWGYLGTTSSGRTYFEVYEDEEMQEDLLSLYIVLYENSFAADIGEEDAWVFDFYLDESDSVFFSPELENGALYMNYHCVGKNTSFDISFFLREEGTPWDEENDPLPPGYEAYKEQYGLTGSGAGIDINSGGSTFTIGGSGDNYGEDGWAYTKTGSMSMRIPGGWEVSNILAEKTMAVRSAQSGGDSIGITIEEYFNSTPQEKRTPENQVLLNHSSAQVTKEKWGNADVWYRIDEWSDYNNIAGYAAYDAGHYVKFDIRVQKANGTVAEFMKSAAWETLTSTFELKTP